MYKIAISLQFNMEGVMYIDTHMTSERYVYIPYQGKYIITHFTKRINARKLGDYIYSGGRYDKFIFTRKGTIKKVNPKGNQLIIEKIKYIFDDDNLLTLVEAMDIVDKYNRNLL